MPKIAIDLPFPPSTNTLFRNVPGRGRVRTKRYLTWWRVAANELLAQRTGLDHAVATAIWRAERVGVSITLGRPDSRPRRDLDNLAKAILDRLSGVIWMDDDRVVQLSLQWGGKPKRALVEIEPL